MLNKQRKTINHCCLWLLLIKKNYVFIRQVAMNILAYNDHQVHAAKPANYHKADEKRRQLCYCKAKEILHRCKEFSLWTLTSRQSSFVTGGKLGKLRICRTRQNFATGARGGKWFYREARQNLVSGGKRGKLQVVPSWKSKAILEEFGASSCDY